jgi:hypothetical protein
VAWFEIGSDLFWNPWRWHKVHTAPRGAEGAMRGSA